MFTHTEIKNSCNRVGINPQTKGNNIHAKSWPALYRKRPINLIRYKFPRKEWNEVRRIGILINNLVSQEMFPRILNFCSQKGKEEGERQINIEKILRQARSSQREWFDHGIKKTSLRSSNYLLHNGNVYVINLKAVQSMEKMNKDLAEFKRESDRRQRASLESASYVVLNA